ncbi:hypothetical protein ACJQWK_11047 [Exserohilum turcicum]
MLYWPSRMPGMLPPSPAPSTPVEGLQSRGIASPANPCRAVGDAGGAFAGSASQDTASRPRQAFAHPSLSLHMGPRLVPPAHSSPGFARFRQISPEAPGHGEGPGPLRKPHVLNPSLP